MNQLTKKYWLRLALATIKDLKKSYMRVAQVRHNRTQWISDPEMTKALGFMDKQTKEIYDQI